MRSLFTAVLFGLFILPVSVSAFERGDTAYVCSKNQKFMWVVGQDSWTACPVRILQKAGGSYQVLAHQKSCLMSGSGMISRGREKWVESYQLWRSRSACEKQGKKASKPQDRSIKITNKCKKSIEGFVYYKNLSGVWTKGKFFNIPNDGKVYTAWDAKTKNRIIDYYITHSGSVFPVGKKDGSTLQHNGKSVKLSRFESAQIPVHMVFCK